jgi:hypothetical protein
MSKTVLHQAAKDESMGNYLSMAYPWKGCFHMNRTEFSIALAECAAATETYLQEAEKTSKMLGKCSQQPLTFEERLALLSQEILERDAFRIYLDSKRFLHRAALRGYSALSFGLIA